MDISPNARRSPVPSLASFSAASRRRASEVDPIVALLRSIKLLGDMCVAAGSQTWMMKELRALLNTMTASLELLRPQTKDWSAVTQDLKKLVGILSALLRRLTSKFEKHVSDPEQFLNYIQGADFVTDFNKFMINGHNLQSFLLRFGINGGLISEVGCVQFALSTTIWRYPVTYIPNRNLLFVPRNGHMSKLEQVLRPSMDMIKYTCIVGTQGCVSVGITEMVLEYCYRSIEDGIFGAVAWITGNTLSSICRSFRYFAKRILLSDRTFCKNVEVINKMSVHEIIEIVVEWLQKLHYPWLIVFDGVIESQCILNIMIPQFGSGTVVFTTSSSCIDIITDKCVAAPEVIEIGLLTHPEKLEIASCLLNHGDDVYSEGEILELLKYFGGHPLEIIEACSVITTGNNRLQLNFGINQYLDKLKAAEARGMLERELIIFQTLYAALDVVIMLPRASEAAVTALVNMIPFFDAEEIDARLLMKWLLASENALMLSVTLDGLNIIQSSDIAILTTESLLTILVTSLVPHDLLLNGGTHHSWKIQKTFLELQTFFDDMKRSSEKLMNIRFPGKPKKQTSGAPESIRVSVDDINYALKNLCSDQSWKQSYADPDVKVFLGIIPSEDVFADAGSRIISIVEPLESVGLFKVKHSFGVIDNAEQCVTIGICRDFHKAMTVRVEQVARENDVLDKVFQFLMDELLLSESKSSKGAVILSPEALVPHIIRCSSFDYQTASTLELVSRAFSISEKSGLVADLLPLAHHGLKIALSIGKQNSREEIAWNLKLARTLMSLGMDEKAKNFLYRALELGTQLNVKYDVATIQGKLSLVEERLGNYANAELHLTKALEAWNMCFHEKKQEDVANCMQHLARIYRLGGKIERSLEFDIMAIDLLSKVHGSKNELVLIAQHDFGKTLMSIRKFDSAIAALQKLLHSYESLEGDAGKEFSLNDLKLTHPNAPSVCMDIADCFAAQKRYFDAEKLLNQCLDALFDIYRDRPHESVGIILDKLAMIQTDQGNLEVALKSLKDALDIFRCTYEADDVQIAHAMNKIGNHLKLLGKFAFAESYYKGAVDTFEKKPGRDAAHAMVNLSHMLMSQDRFDEAITFAHKAVLTYRRLDLKQANLSFELAAAITLESDLFQQQGLHEKALNCLEDVLLVLNGMSGDHSFSIAEVYEKMASLYHTRDMSDEQIRYEKLANAIYQQHGVPSSETKLSRLSNVILSAKRNTQPIATEQTAAISESSLPKTEVDARATALHRQESSEELQKKEVEDQNFLKMQEELITNLVQQYGEKHQRVASALNNLSHLLIKRQRYDEALRMLSTSLEILLELYGDTHAHVATVYQNIGFVYQQRGQYEEASILFQQALKVRRELSGDISPHVAQSLNSLGLVYRAQGKYLDAKLCMEESLHIRRVLYGHNHFSIGVALNSLGMLQKSMWLFKDAEISLRDSLSVRKATYDAGHPSIAASMVNLGSLLVSMGKLTEARALFESALKMQNKAYGENSKNADIAKTKNFLAEIDIKENRLTSAKTILEELIRARSDIHGSNNEEFYLNIGRLSRLYHAIGLTGDAEKIDEMLSQRSGTDVLAQKNDDKFIMLPEIEEDDKIVSRLLSFGSFSDSTKKKSEIRLESLKNNDKITDTEDLVQWLTSLGETFYSVQSKRKQETESAGDVEAALFRAFEDSDTDVVSLMQVLDENRSKISKLEKLAETNPKFNRELMDVKYDTVSTEKDLENTRARRSELESDLEAAKRHLSITRKELHRIEECVPLFETLRVSVLASISNIENISSSVARKREEVAEIFENPGTADIMERQNAFVVAEKDRMDLENHLRTEQEQQNKAIQDILELCEKVGINVLSPYTSKENGAGVSPGGPGSSNRRKSHVENIDDITSIDSFDSDESDGDENDNTKQRKSVLRLKKKIKHQQMLIELLRSQLLGLGVRPIDEVVSFSRAEARLKESLKRLLEGDESAAAEFERWDEYVRNHPEFKLREVEKLAQWQHENEPLNEAALFNIKSFVPADIYTCTKEYLAVVLPKPLARRIFTEKALWLLRLSPVMIAKMHIADLQTKYSTQALDEIELRAVFASLPEKFENDHGGEKAGWKMSILQRLQGKRTELPWSGQGVMNPPEEVVLMFMKSIPRNGAYRNAPEFGPFDPNLPPVVYETPGAAYHEPEKYDASMVYGHGDNDVSHEGTAESILTTVQMLHNRFSHENKRPTYSLPLDIVGAETKQARQLSSAKLRSRKSSTGVGYIKIHADDHLNDTFEMFPSQHSRLQTFDETSSTKMLDGLEDAVSKRRALLENSKDISPKKGAQWLSHSSSASFGLSAIEEVSESTSPRSPLRKGESFRAPVTKIEDRTSLLRGGSYRSPDNKRTFLRSAGKQKSIILTGPANSSDPSTPRQAVMTKQPSGLMRLFVNRKNNDINDPQSPSSLIDSTQRK